MTPRYAFQCLSSCAVALLLAGIAPAQGAVSPFTYESRVGNSETSLNPFVGQGFVLQQIHTDLRGRIQTIRELGFRQGRYNHQWSAARVVDLDVSLGDSSFANRSRADLSRNFVGSPTLVFTRKRVNAPDLTLPAPSYPTPFTILLPFDTPWAYSSQWDLCYQIAVYTNSLQFAYAYALDTVEMRDWNIEIMTKTGTGCWVTGRPGPMEHFGTARTYRSSNKHSLAWQAIYGPTGALSTFLIGLTNPNRFWPALCTFQYVDDVFLVLRTFADLSGNFASPTVETPYIRELEGFIVRSQAYSLDPRHPALIPVSATDGGELGIPPQPPPPVDIASFWQQGQNPIGGRDGLGTITRFR